LGSEKQGDGPPGQKERSLKIAIIGSKGVPATYGGVEKHVEELAVRLAGRGHRVSVYCRPYYVDGDSQFRGVARIVRPTVRQKHLEMIVHTGIAVLDSLVREFDIIHFQSVDPAILSFVGKMSARVVVTSHGRAYRVAKWGRYAKSMSMLAERLFVRVPQARIAVSKTLTEYYGRRYGCRVLYIPNGVAVQNEVGDDRVSGFSLELGGYILFVGRLIRTKGCHLLIDAYKSLNTEKRLVIVGDVGYSSQYYRVLKSNESDRIMFLGFKFGEDLRQLLHNCSLFVQPSESEGLSMTLLEAMSMAKPVVYSDIPENVEVALGCGLPFRSGDSADLARAMDEVLGDPPLGKRLGESGRKKAREEYNWDAIALATEEVYTDLCSV
jgi:glycosyltransferase involved in cell wall biosynthesis